MKQQLLLFKLIVFDLDGTLYNSTKAWIATERKIAKQLGVLLPEKKVHWSLFGKSVKERIGSLFSKKQQKKAIELFFGKERPFFLSGFKLFSDTKLLLQYLKNKGIKIAVATGLDRDALDIILTRDKLWKFVDTTLTTEEVGKEKPNPNILFQILKKFRIKPQEAIYVGDAFSDIETAKKAKMKIIIITRGAISDSKMALKFGADCVFNDFSELLYSIK